MPDWQDLRYFAALAEVGSLLGAARAMGVEHATISRRVAALEGDMGLKLVDRRGRRLMLTEDGRRIADIAARMKTEANALARLMIADTGLDGEVTITAPPSYAIYQMAQPLARLHHQHPGLRLRVLGETRYASLDRREADLAIRLSRPETGDFIIRKIGVIVFRVYASPDYLRAVFPEQWDYIAYDEVMDEASQQRWLWERTGERGFALRASSLEMQREFARLGCGVAILPEFMAGPDSGLTAALPDEPPVKREVWLTVHADLKNSPAVRAVMDAFTLPT